MTDYILVGDSSGIATPSSILIDIRLDLLDLRTAEVIIGFPNGQFPNAQVLSSLANGFLYNTAGIVSSVATIPLTDIYLTEGNIWIGNSSNRPTEHPSIALNNLANLSKNKTPDDKTKAQIWIGNDSNRPEEGNNIGPEGPRGFPGLDFIAIAEAIFRKIFETLFGKKIGDVLSSIFNKLFEEWLKLLLHGVQGLSGISGLSGLAGLLGLSGANVGNETEVMSTNIDLSGNRIENIAQSPGGDYDALSLRFVWDLLHDNVIINWQ